MIVFCFDFSSFLMPKCRQVGTNVEAKRDINLKTLKAAKEYKIKHNDFSIVWGFGASALTTKVDETSIKKRSQYRGAFWHRCLVVLGRCWVHFGSKKVTQINRENIEKQTSGKYRPRRPKRPNMGRRPSSEPPILVPGEGVGGGVNHSLKGSWGRRG